MNCRSRSWFLGDLELNIRSKNIGCHIATPGQQRKVNKVTQRREIAMSRRHHDFCTNIIKSKGRPNFGIIDERADWEVENRAAMTWIIREETFFCIFLFSDKLRMIVRLMMFISSSSMF